jgi:hypothetical protein
VVWKRVYFRPSPASRSAVGVPIGPPNALDAPNPTSSSSTTRTLGAPGGGRSRVIGGNDVSGSFASYVVSPACARSGIGRTDREMSGVLMSASLPLPPVEYDRRHGWAQRPRRSGCVPAASLLHPARHEGAVSTIGVPSALSTRLPPTSAHRSSSSAVVQEGTEPVPIFGRCGREGHHPPRMRGRDSSGLVGRRNLPTGAGNEPKLVSTGDGFLP